MPEPLTTQQEHDADVADIYWQMEREWRSSLPKYSPAELFKIYPEAVLRHKPTILKAMKFEVMFLEARLTDMKLTAEYALVNNHLPWRDDIIKEGARREMDEIGRQIRRLRMRIADVRNIGRKSVESAQSQKVRITDGMIAKAKEFPLDQLIEVNRQGFAKCIWHTDSKPSMFCKKNFVHCFVCAKGGDTIALVMQKDSMSFREAVMRLQ